MQKFLFVLLCFLFKFSIAQRSELSINYRYGISSNKINLLDPDIGTDLHYKQIRTSWDQGTNLNYNHLLWKKFGLYGIVGVDFSWSKHSFPILAGYGNYHLTNVEVKQSRFAYRIGLFKRFTFYNESLNLDIGARIVDRYYTAKNVNYFQSETQSHRDWLNYSYDLNAYYGQYFMNPNQIQRKRYMYLNTEYFIRLGFKIRSDLFLNINFEYARNNIFFYDFNYTVFEYLGGSTTPTGVYQNFGLAGPSKYGVRDHFIYTSVGLTYKFSSKQ